MRIGIPKTGKSEGSAIGLGTLRTFEVTSEEDISVRQDIVDNCIASQGDLIDTAAWYGNAEQVVGETIAGKRDKFYLATKVRCEGKEEGEAQIARSFGHSIKGSLSYAISRSLRAAARAHSTPG